MFNRCSVIKSLLNLLCIIFAGCFGALANSSAANSNSASWLTIAEQKQLAASSEWRSLLHINSGLATDSSFVDDKKFFLDADGNFNPQAELAATITAFFNKPETQCRFVARRLWLSRQLPGFAAQIPLVQCDAYLAWRKEINVDKVVLVFASSYLNSPSSMYGHTFLRFDPPAMQQGESLLSYALNFGASVAEADNGFLYAYKGIFGGYPGLFASEPYLEKVKEYSRLENRDLWEYQLNLNENEIDLMMAHIWELDQINFAYYFFDENCSFRLLELLEVARPNSRLIEQFPHVAIPLDTVRATDAAGMIADVVYRPSYLTQLDFQINQLDAHAQTLAKNLADDIAVADSAEFLALEALQQQRVLRLAYSHLRYTKNQQQRDAKTARRSYLLLRKLSEFGGGADSMVNPPQPLAPDKGHNTTLFSLAAGRADESNFVDLEWRLSYHDLLDNIAGYAPGASLNMAKIVLRQKAHDSLQLQELDILDITSLSSRNQFLQPLSWRVNTGMTREWTDGEDTLAAQTNAGVGWSFATSTQSRFSALLIARLEHNKHFAQNTDVAVGAAAGYLHQGKNSSSGIDIEFYQFSDGIDRTAVGVSHNINTSINSAIRLDVKHNLGEGGEVNEFRLAYRYYY